MAQTGEVRGVINDAANNDPIPFANIIVDGTTIGSTSDLDGNFIITGLKPGYINLKVSYVGYQTKITSYVLISNSNIPFIEIKMEPSQNELEEVVVKVDYLKKTQEAPLSMQSIGTKQIEGNPGSNRDISRVIQSFPGVGSTPAFRNDVIIRGGGPSENRFFLDLSCVTCFNEKFHRMTSTNIKTNMDAFIETQIRIIRTQFNQKINYLATFNFGTNILYYWRISYR